LKKQRLAFIFTNNYIFGAQKTVLQLLMQLLQQAAIFFNASNKLCTPPLKKMHLTVGNCTMVVALGHSSTDLQQTIMCTACRRCSFYDLNTSIYFRFHH